MTNAKNGTLPRRAGLSVAQQALLENRLRGAAGTGPVAPTITPRSERVTAPLSFAQQRLWFLEQLEPDSPLYNLPTAVRIGGQLDREALTRAISAIVARHEALRMRVVAEEGIPVQTIAAVAPVELSLVDLAPRPAAEREAALRRVLEAEAKRAFDLSRGPLLRVMLVRLGETEHVLMVNMHHIVSDAWSLGVFFRELAALYGEFCGGPAAGLPELPIQQPDYAAWQRDWMQGGVMAKQLAYWKRHLDGAPHLLELPADQPRPVVQSFAGGVASRPLPRPLSEALKRLSQAEGSTLFMTLLAAFKVLLHRYTRQANIVVGSPIACRNQLETEGLIGFFVNTLALHTNLSGQPTFRETLARVKQGTLDGIAHQDLPFERLVEELQPSRSLGYTPLVQVVFMFQTEPAKKLRLPGLTISPLPLETGTSKFDLTLAVEEQPDGLLATVEYSTDLFEPPTIDRMLGHFQTLLEAIVADPSQRIGELPLLTSTERHQVLVAWNDTRTDYPRSKTIPQLFEEQAAQTPDAIAVVFGETRLNYRELNERANRLAHHLQRHGVTPGANVGVCLERSLELIVALLGILKAGGAYISLDPAYPQERLAFMLADVRATVVLTQEKLRSALPELGSFAPTNGGSRPPSVVCLDTGWPAIAEENLANPVSGATAESPAYVSFTSGSTGRPKGVCVPHRGVARLVKETNYARFGPDEIFLQLAPVAFDASTLEIWGPLLNGGRLVIFPPQTPTLAELGELIQRQRITTLWLTAGLFHQMADDQLDGLRGVRQLLTGGDVLSVPQVKKVLQKLEGGVLINGYGPTENTTFTCCHRITARDADARSIPIGRPVANTQVFVLDEYHQPVPVGVPGELYTGGDGLALGYVDRPELTAEKFIAHPFSPEPDARLYRTGDLVRWRADGVIEFIGRMDLQVKIRGFRVELGEIETVLSRHPAVRECTVTAPADASGGRQLVAYFVNAAPLAPGLDELREHLRRTLPDYMVPAVFVRLESLPLNAHGKLDRKLLPAPERAAAEAAATFVAPRDSVEGELARIWEDVLGVKPIGVTDHFFDLGGHSLMAVRLVARIEKIFGRKIPVATVFLSPTIRQLANVLREKPDTGATSSIVAIQPRGTKPPLFFVHGVGGGMFWGYTNLARYLGTDQPVHAFKSRSMDGLEEFGTIEEMAAHYVSELRALQPEGPYYIGGYCFGGNVAYEMARQLRAQGARIELLALINCAPPNSGYDHIRFGPAFCVKFLKNLGYWSSYVLHLKSAQRREFLRWKLRAIKRKLSRGVPSGTAALNFNVEDFVDLTTQPEGQRSLWEAHIQALFRHQTGTYAGHVTLFRTRGHTLLCSFDEAFGWREFASTVSVRIVPGAHESILDEPHVQALAGELKRCLQEMPDQESEAPGTAAETLAYWKKQLAAAPPLMDLPVDHPRPPVPTNRGGREIFAIDDSLASKLRSLSQSEGGTLFVTLSSAFQALISRYTSRDDIVIGSSTVANRDAAAMAKRNGHPPGNLLVLRTDLAADPTFRQLLALTQDTVQLAQEHQMSFEALVEELQSARETSYHPIVQVAFNFQNTRGPVACLALRGESDPDSGRSATGSTLRTVSQLDLELNVTESSSGLKGWFEYSRDLFEPATIQKMREHWIVLLEGAVANPDCRLSELPLLTAGERRQMLVDWNDTALAFPPAASLVSLFEAQATRTPEATALIAGVKRLSYRELNERANKMAHHLRTLGVGPEVLVGLCVERSERMLVGILGILKAGGAYVPMDPTYPKDRLAFMLDDANAPVLVTEQCLLPIFPFAGEASARRAVVRLDTDWNNIEKCSSENMREEATAENLAYVIYTSGSTGQPKGVAIEHRAPVALMHWAKEVFSLDEISGVLAATSICFDLSIFEMFVPLSWGGTVILADNAMALATLPASGEVTLVNTVPSAMRELLRVKGIPASVRIVNLAGEPLATSLVDQIYAETSVAKVYDLYGPSETTTYSTGALRIAGEAATIGRPLANEQVYLLDRRQQPVPVGVPGELYIGGSGLAREYLHRPELTAEKFVPNPFRNGGLPERLYRTGDLARYRPDGNIEFLGRMDHQVKIRGFRIELGEIENALRRHPKLLEVVVLAREEQPGDKRLAAYFVSRPDQSATANELRIFLKEKLPDYMVPSAFISLVALPLTANGKVDRKRLPAPDQARPELHGNHVAPGTPTEITVAGIWCEVLRLKQSGVHDNFFELGGDSLLAIQVVSRLRQSFGVEVPLTALFEASTVAALAEGLTTARWGKETSAAPPLFPALRNGNPPLSFSQQSLWFIDQLEPGSFAYNVPAAVVLEGSLDVSVLQECLNAICRRHEILRTTFTAVEGEPAQVISSDSTLAMSLVDLREVALAEKESEAHRVIAAEVQRSFELACGPLIRCTLLHLEKRKHILIMVMHHTVSDGWSLAVFFRELAAHYEAKIAGKAADLPELPVQYADYATWQRGWLQGEALEKHLEYWRGKLAGAPASLNLPADHSASAESVPRGAHQLATLSRPLIESLQGLNRRQGTTSFMTLLAALAIVLNRWTRQSDMVVGTVAAGRTRREVENLIGCFMNFLPLRLKFSGSETGVDVLSLVRASVLESHAHLDCPFEKVVEAINPERHQHRNPIYNVGFLLQNFPRIVLATPQLTGSFLSVEPDVALLDLRFVAEENDQGISMKCEYRTDMFEAQTIEQLLSSFCRTLEALVEHPETKLADFALSDVLERRAETARARLEKDMVAISATFTAEPLAEPLQFWMKELDLPVAVEFAPYNQVFQQLLDPASVLARNRRGLNVILIRMEDWLRAEGDGAPVSDFKTKIEQNLGEFILALKSGAARGATSHLVCFCPSAKIISSAPQHTDFFRQMEQRAARELAGLSSVQVITSEELFALYPAPGHYDPQGDELGHIPYTPAFFAALATMIARRFHAMKRPAYKVIALDCDQTLWTGVCGEDGPGGIHLDPPRRALQEFMRAQLDAGRLLCLCSKNNEADVRVVFEQRTEMPLRREHFVASRINWQPKSENLKSLATELKLGMDSFIFVDDNPVECAEVEANCPEVLTLLLPTTVEAIPQFLKHCWALDHSKATVEDRQRTTLYQQNEQREQLRTQSPGLADFVAGLDLKIHIAGLAPEDLARVAQLTLRTNQFNTTTCRRTEAEIQKLQDDENYSALTTSVSDRFGDYGLVGAVIYRVEADALAADTFLLSCRVLGRGVEHQILARLGQIADERGVAFVDVHFVPSAKNQPAFDFLQNVGAPFRQALNGGYVFRFPTEFASALKFKPQNQELIEAPLRVVMPSVVATNGAQRFSRYQWIAREADDADKIVQMIEARAVVRPGAQLVGTGPRSDLERQLCGIWEKLLRVERVGIHDNFFELGGHSLLAVRMFAQVEKLVGKKLPVVTVFQSPTIDQLTKAIGAIPSEAEHPNLVPIQPHGSKPPLFLVHGAGGDVLWGYANLAHHTDPEQPIYGIQACGDEEFATLEDMATYYVEKVRAFQPSGPYHLGGYCFGGNVAQEMARQLEAQGETTALLALLDCAPSNRGYENIQWRPRLLVDYTRNLGIWFDNFFQLKPAERHSLIVRKLRTLPRKGWERLRGRHSPEGFDLEEFIDTTHVSERETRLWKNHLRLLVRHASGRYAGPITLFRTRGHPLVCSFEDDFGWGKLAALVTVRKIPGSHEGIFMEPHVQFAAGELNQALRAVQEDKNAVLVSL